MAHVLLVLASLCGACARTPSKTAAPHLPAGNAGQILSQAIEAAGGWERWKARRGLDYINTLTLFDPDGNVTSETIGWYTALLHGGLQARMESIGLDSEVSFRANGAETWGLRDGELIGEPQRLELARFSLASNLFWFSLPFALAEMPGTVTDLGDVPSGDRVNRHRLKVVFEPGNPAVPGEWFVLYINAKTGLIDRVHARINTSFLRQELWVGKWLDYRDCNGLKKERRRKFFPADDTGKIIGDLVAEQLVEHVRFNDGFPDGYFDKPTGTPKAAPVRQGPAPPLKLIATQLPD